MDEEAGNLGLPFTEPEDEEARSGWAGSTGGGVGWVWPMVCVAT